MQRSDEARKAIERKWVRLDSCRHELKELTAAVGLVIDTLTKRESNETEPVDIENATDTLFVIRRDMQRIADDMGEIAEGWQAHDKTLEE